MFPTVRLLIAAVFASVVALSCGFGVFAAFRVNHEPFGRQAAVPLRMLDRAAAAAPAAWGAPFGPGFHVSGAQSDAAATDAEALAPMRGQRNAANPWTAGTVQPAALTESAPLSAGRFIKLDAAAEPTTAATSPTPMPGAFTQAIAALVPSPAQTHPGAQAADVTGSIDMGSRAEPIASPVTVKAPAQTHKIFRGTVRRHRPRPSGKRVAARPAYVGFAGDSRTEREPVFQTAPHAWNPSQPRARTATNGQYAEPGSAFGSHAAQ